MAATRPLPPARPLLPLCAALLVSVAASGCVQRRMTIRSSPPGALVYVDDYQIGSTPVSTDFIYYGTRKIRLVKDGFETLTVRQPFPMPWYQVFPLDFVTENLWPWEIRDERVIDLAMTPADSQPAEAVVARAQQVRLAAGSLPPPPTAGPPSLPSLPGGWRGGPAPATAPPQGPLAFPAPALQAPFQNAPAQGQPSLGLPPSGF
ncbi:MAG: PEGA domain-containing protein [Planctomycetaceae bacterium]